MGVWDYFWNIWSSSNYFLNHVRVVFSWTQMTSLKRSFQRNCVKARVSVCTLVEATVKDLLKTFGKSFQSPFQNLSWQHNSHTCPSVRCLKNVDVLLLSLPKLHSSAWSTVKHFIMSHLSHDAHKTDAQQTIFSVRFAIWAEAWKQRQATHMPAVKAWACSSVKMYFWDVFPCRKGNWRR